MNSRSEIVIRILLFIAKMYAPDEWKKELEHLTNHIHLYGKGDK